MNQTEQSLHDAVVMNLRNVYDPEISLNIHDL
jgi:metal-sulfur cluster biosynthetic enzyme